MTATVPARALPFELDWQGGAAERYVRRKRPIDDYPWGTIDPRAYPPELVARARESWTFGAYNEYCTAAAFAEVQRALLTARAPIDLVGMAGEFVADEMLHTELNARMAMELGGAAPLRVDFEALTPQTTPGASPRELVSELVIRTSCVGEAFSVPILTGTLNAAGDHPLTKAVLGRIVKDEAPHASLGWLYLDWAQEWLTPDERQRLGRVAAEAIRDYLPRWSELSDEPCVDGVTPEGYQASDVGALGWMTSDVYVRTARQAVAEKIVAPLAQYGIEVRTPECGFTVSSEHHADSR